MAGRKISSEASFSRRRFVFMILGSIVLWAVASVFLFFLSYVFHWGLSRQSLEEAGQFWQCFGRNPASIWTFYLSWLEILGAAVRTSSVDLPLLLPLLPTLLFCFGWAVFLRRSGFAFHLWYHLHNRLARKEDIEAMGLFRGHLMNLGTYEGKTIRLSQAYPVFCLGPSGSGKTSGVAIPSLLEADGYSVVAMDNNGGLARYSSGYRAGLGPVFYFNWELEDNPAQGEYWPRWNPLSFEDMPPAGKLRDAYLSFLVRRLLSPQRGGEDNYWQRLMELAFEGLLQFFVCKIEQAQANDYFLSLFLEKSRLSSADKELLLSYYADMPEEYSREAIRALRKNKLTHDNYLPVGSWDGIPEVWQGKELCLAMFTDFLLRRYFDLSAVARSEDVGGWKLVLESFLAEAELFAYHQKALAVLRQISYLSRKQRGVIFPMLLKALAVFRSGSLRERTSVSDFRLKDVRGRLNSDGAPEPVSVYCVAGSRSSKLISCLLTDSLLNKHLREPEKPGDFPVLYVLDDLSDTPPLENLRDGLMSGRSKDISFLLLGNDLCRLQQIYSTEGLEEIIAAASYKLMIGDNNRQLSQNFFRLAEFGTKTVQIPMSGSGLFSRANNSLSDTGYYLKLAKDLESRYKKDNIKKGYHLLLAEGYYHLPMKLKTDYFYKNEALRHKALGAVAYLLNSKIYRQRNPQDKETPDILSALRGAGICPEHEEDIDRYLDDSYEKAVEKMQVLPDVETVMADDISTRWKSSDPDRKGQEKQSDDDWWLSEDGFALGEQDSGNPFEKKDDGGVN